MSDKQVALIIDDSGQINGAALFEPELTVQTVGCIADGTAYLTTQRGIAIIVINTEASMADRIALLRLIRANAACAGSIVAVMIDNRDTVSINALCEEGADEIIMRQMDASVHILQLQKLLHMHRGHQFAETHKRANQLHAVIEGLATGVGLFAYEDGKMRALYMNDSFVQGARLFLRMKGDGREDALALLPAREAGIIQNALEANLKDGTPINMVFHLPTESQLQKALRLRALPIHYEGHESPVFLVHLVDVTDQQIVETALKESNQKLAALMNAVPGGIALFDFEASPRLLYHNETLCQMLGYTEEEFIPLVAGCFKRLIDPRDHQKMTDLIKTFRQEQKPMDTVFRALNKDGSIRWLRVNTSSMGQGLLCSAVFIDVTREKESEAKSIRMLNELTHAAEHDALTGIANREGFYRMTAELLKRDPDTAYTILMMDIDRFRVVNDMFGKDVGDQILIAIAQGMAHLLAPIGTCARLGSDRFVACFPQRLLNIDRIMRLVDQGLKRHKLDYHIQMSFGIYAINDPTIPVYQMCDRATIALKTIKGYAVQHYAVYDEHLRLSMLEESNILEEMYGALSHNQFQIYLQPIFSVETRQPVSAEVLVRWQHPEKGLISPNRFIPLFERNGFITRLDLHVLEETCRMLADWHKRNYPMPVSVNLSRIDLYNTHLTDYLMEMLERYGVSPSQLRLELTESAYSKDPDALILAINRLRAVGFSILMDDFGSGYSSLNVLMDMPVDMIKLDMRFLAQLNVNPRAASILTSVVRMAKWLHMPVVAEGVETPDQFSFLRSIGCDHVQGYLLAKPMPLSQYTEQYINTVTAPFGTELPAPHSSVDLTCLWDGSPQTDTLFNGMIGAMGIYELSGEILEVRRVNDGYFELFGASPKQVFENAQDGLSDIHPDDRESLLALCRHAMETGRVERITCRHIHTRSGRQPWLETRIRHLGAAGLNNVFAISFTDVTEQKEFEQARTLKNYAMVLRTVYSSVFELNLTQGTSRAVHLTDGQHAIPDHEQPLDALKAWLSGILLQEDDELTSLILTPGCLNQLVRANASGYYLVERRVRGTQPEGSWASFTFIRVPSDEAAEVYLMCVADVDSRKRADELLQNNRWLQMKQTELAHYQSMMEHLGTSLLEWDVRNMAVTASGGFANYALSTFDFKRFTSHKDLEPYVYQSDLSIFRMFVNDVIAHGNAAVTIRLLDQSGQPVWCRVLCSLLLGNGTKVARFVAAINRIDEQMKIRESYLEEQARFQAFSDNFLFGLGVYEVSNEKHRIVFLSNGYRKIVGFDDEEPLAEETHSFLGVHPDDIPLFQAATDEMLQTGKPYTIDYRVSHKDGHTLWLRSRNAVYPGTKPGQYRIFAVIQNITELHTLQGRMKGLIEHLPAAVAIYDLSAESRTLMQTRHMEAAAAAGNPIALDADALARIRRAYEQGRRELDEVMTLSLPTGETQRARVLATMVPSESILLCYCAVVPLQA